MVAAVGLGLVFLVLVLRSHPAASDQTIDVTGVHHFTKFSSCAQMTDVVVRIDLQTEAHTTGDILAPRGISFYT